MRMQKQPIRQDSNYGLVPKLEEENKKLRAEISLLKKQVKALSAKLIPVKKDVAEDVVFEDDGSRVAAAALVKKAFRGAKKK